MTDSVRWLVTGARGQLGSELVAALSGRDVTAVGRAELDISSDGVWDTLRAWAGAGAPGSQLVVLNAAAWTDVDGAESDPAGAAAANTHGPARLASACAQLDATLVHLSTDYVFSGNFADAAPRPYDVDDPVAPIGVYGVTKEAGERAVRARLARHYIVRTAWVYGATGRNFVKTIAGLRHQRATIDVVDDQRGCPTWAAELADRLIELVGVHPPYGTYHCAGGGEASRFELARAVFSELGEDPERVRPCDTARFPTPAPRPAYTVLSDRSWTAAGLKPQPHWRDALRSAFRRDRSSFDTPSLIERREPRIDR
ncbi:MAG: dTDP-4-dehydrorhamnose reductase [Pseudonocardia sp.]|nr:dTDP-4-dehydrorhamnose reductase [Pseudonocardia sp.]